MTTYESPALDGAIDRPGSLSSPNDSADNTRRRLELGERAGKYLDSVCDGIADGRLDLWQLPISIASIYFLGYAHAELRYSCNHANRIARLEYERDLYYWLASNPGKSGADFLKFQTNALWAEGVAA
jgi:hypothetical protein